LAATFDPKKNQMTLKGATSKSAAAERKKKIQSTKNWFFCSPNYPEN
jgi:hypothetical protein